ncbi:MAG: hypothetical protein E7613_06875 [Ruminococcaceae bacterium]|nr:hypothetical protein [Oscillospiraceae bacterium]
MKKILITVLLLAAFSIACLAADEIMIGTPVVDGMTDSIYQTSYKIEINGEKHTFHTGKGGQPDGSKGASATAYYLYDDNFLYVSIDVKDESVFSRGKAWIIKNIAALSWENDAVEARVYYPELGDPVQANQYIFQCDAKGVATTNYLGMCEKDHIAATTLNENGYTVEFAIPLSFDKKAGDMIGLSIEIDDLHELVSGADSPMGAHNFNAYGSQHPYKNMVKLGKEKVANRVTVYDDTKNHWGRDEISYVVQASLFNGTGKGFEPDTTMTRAMFATVLGRLYEIKKGPLTQYDNAAKFKDVDYKSWYGKYVDWASGAGIVNGYENGSFKPDAPITREEMAVMIFRFANTSHTEGKLDFKDASKISDWAKVSVSYCVDKGYINGNEKSEFLPKNNATRAEVSALMARYLKAATARLYK